MTQYYFDTELSTEADLLNLATKSLAGRAGVELVYGRLDLGASEDIQRALSSVRQWIGEFGGSEFAGIVSEQKVTSEKLLTHNEHLAAAKLSELYRAAKTLLRERYDFLLAVQRALLQQETLLGSDIAVIRHTFQ